MNSREISCKKSLNKGDAIYNLKKKKKQCVHLWGRSKRKEKYMCPCL